MFKFNAVVFTIAILSATLLKAVAFTAFHRRTTYHVTTKLHDASDDGNEKPKEKKGFFANFFEELDAFVDDATSRRLGNGAQYYGKRKSSFYGKNDPNKKRDSNVFDPTEDYRGPSNAGYFKWMADPETGEMKPVTRLKERVIEKKIM
ncbi:hypothetical protein HJC23_001154 [Cyclotella cryptica]|uniref:Uncharacterized protein n=1 Tax=Cyclotella cryptica TaxID=29204 RepID=A0ABD3P663_9STRA